MKSPEIWSVWLNHQDQKTPWKVLDSSPNVNLVPESTEDWICALGIDSSWYGTEKDFLQQFKPFMIEPKVKWTARPEIKKKPKPKKPRG